MPAPPPRLLPVRRGLTLHLKAPGPLHHATAWSLGPVVPTDAASALYPGTP